eukprot:7144170-Heterocapsa_arctica.AAC.1
MAPRTAGFLPGSGDRKDTCYPDTGDPKVLDFFLVSHCPTNSVVDYQALPRGIIPSHRPVKLTLQLSAMREPVDTLWKPRSFTDKFPVREKVAKGQQPKAYGP